MKHPLSPISGHTTYYAVLGHPVAHSLSPLMQNAALAELGLDARYLAFDVEGEGLPMVLRSMGQMGFRGVNLTIPHKETGYRTVDVHAETAKEAGSVNTVRFLEDGRLEGHSTDGYGLVAALREELGVECGGRAVLILGCGGAGRAAALRAVGEGATRVLLANRGAERRETLAREIRERGAAPEVEVCPAWPPPPAFVREAEVVIQASSMGMGVEESSWVTDGHFRKGQAVLDMTYVLEATPVMREARKAGARAANGLSMLLHQGARSLEIWTGRAAPVEVMRRALFGAHPGESR